MPSRTRALAQAPTTSPASSPARLRCRPDLVRDLAREVLHVRALVAVLGHGLAALHGDDGVAEVRHLRARVVEVVLARHPLAARLEDPAQEVADERATRVAHRQRPGRVGRDELHVDGARVHRGDAAPRLGRGEDPGHEPFVRLVGDAEVDEARPRDLGGRDEAGRSARAEGRRQRLRDVERGAPQRPRQLHREVRREVAERRDWPDARPRRRGGRRIIDGGQRAARRRPGPRPRRPRHGPGHGWPLGWLRDRRRWTRAGSPRAGSRAVRPVAADGSPSYPVTRPDRGSRPPRTRSVRSRTAKPPGECGPVRSGVDCVARRPPNVLVRLATLGAFPQGRARRHRPMSATRRQPRPRLDGPAGRRIDRGSGGDRHASVPPPEVREMRARGTVYSMGAGARKSLVLFWSALFLCSTDAAVRELRRTGERARRA